MRGLEPDQRKHCLYLGEPGGLLKIKDKWNEWVRLKSHLAQHPHAHLQSSRIVIEKGKQAHSYVSLGMSESFTLVGHSPAGVFPHESALSFTRNMPLHLLSHLPRESYYFSQKNKSLTIFQVGNWKEPTWHSAKGVQTTLGWYPEFPSSKTPKLVLWCNNSQGCT